MRDVPAHGSRSPRPDRDALIAPLCRALSAGTDVASASRELRAVLGPVPLETAIRLALAFGDLPPAALAALRAAWAADA